MSLIRFEVQQQLPKTPRKGSGKLAAAAIEMPSREVR